MEKLTLIIIAVITLTSCTSVEPVIINEPDEIIESEPTVEQYDPVSIQALSQKEFDGDNLTLGAKLAQTSTYTRYYITYTSGELTISGIMNVPDIAQPLPVLILNHGYIDPAIYTNGRGLKREQDYFANQGYIVIHPDYRNHASSSKVDDDHLSLRLGYTEDVINLVYAVKNSDLDYINKEKIGMLGHSMGGGITQNILVAKPDLIQAAVLYAPVSADYIDNFEKWTRSRTQESNDIIESYGEPSQDNDFWQNISPINFIDQISAPIMLHHGTADDSVPIEWSEKLNTALTNLNKEITFHIYEDAPHEFIKNWPLFMERSTEFFDEHLKSS